MVRRKRLQMAKSHEREMKMIAQFSANTLMVFLLALAVVPFALAHRR